MLADDAVGEAEMVMGKSVVGMLADNDEWRRIAAG